MRAYRTFALFLTVIMMVSGYSVGPLEPTGDAELDRLDGEARSRLMDLLSSGRDLQDDTEYRKLEERVSRRKHELGLLTDQEEGGTE